MNQLEEITMEHEGWTPASFDHPKNIEIGKGRVIWAEGKTCAAGIHHPEGWVLPGGLRTRDSDVAHAAAATINELSRATA